MKAIVTGDAEHAAHSFDDLPPGAHVAVRASPAQIPDSGLALRLAGFEIRDTIAHIVGDRIVWWILARKPLDGTVAGNVLAHGVGGLNIDACRVGSDGGTAAINFGETRGEMYGGGKGKPTNEIGKIGKGRFPANVLLDEHAAAEMDEQSGVLKGRVGMTKHGSGTNSVYGTYERSAQSLVSDGVEDTGGASRFFPLLDEDGAENWIRRLIDPDQSP